MNRIKEILKEQGRSQKWLCVQIGRSYNMVNSYVQNRRQPSLKILGLIADALNVDAGQLLLVKGSKDVDKIYKDWCGSSRLENSVIRVHDSIECIEFARYYYKELSNCC